MEKPPKVCEISRRDLSVGIYGRSVGLLETCLSGSFTRYVPDYRCIETRNETRANHYEIWHHDCELPSIQQDLDNNRIHVYGSLDDLSEGETIPYLAYSLLERAGMERGEVTLHAAAFTLNGNGILVLGKSGAGKTSLALNMCLNFGCNLVANDLTVIRHDASKLHLVTGTREFYVRAQNIRRYHPSLASRLDGTGNDEWWSRATLYPKEIGVVVENEIMPIRRVIMLHVSAFGGDLVESSIDKRWARIYLYEATSRYILRSRLPILAGDNDRHWLYAPSLDTEGLHAKRVGIVNCIVDTLRYCTVTGGLDEVSEYVYNELR